jgi:transposase InsO family protein
MDIGGLLTSLARKVCSSITTRWLESCAKMGQVRPLRRFVRTTQSDHENPIFPNLAQGFTPTGPDQLWVADFTYVAIAAGFVYVAVILDAWSRRVIGYAISKRIDTRLALAALGAAVQARHPPPRPTVFIIRTGVPNTHQLLITRLWTITGCADLWAVAAIPMTTRKRRAS